MTVRKLKELLANIPDDERVYLDNGDDTFNGDEVIDVSFIRNAFGSKHRVLVRTRDNLDMSAAIEGILKYYSEDNWDENDAFDDLDEYGITLDDFKYDEQRYEYAKQYMN